MEIVRDYLRLIKNEFYILKELSAFESATAGLVEVWGLSRLRRALPIWLRMHRGAHAPAVEHVLIPSNVI